ncbi:MAG: hypothetical protein R3B09_23340 [Nannocystaceae bacterium]
MRRTTLLAAAIAAILGCSEGCSDRPVPDVQRGDGQSGDVCEDDSECVDGAVCFNQVCVQEGLFRVSLSWSVVSDFDLHVVTPYGNEVSYATPSNDAGYLDVDDCVYGVCTDPSGVHVENIYFNAMAVPGTYRVYVMNFDGAAPGQYTVEVAGAVTQTWSGELPGIPNTSSVTYEFEFMP